MRRAILAASLLAMAGPALAQQQDAVEAEAARQWQAAQTGQHNAAMAFGALVDDRRATVAELAELRLWAECVALRLRRVWPAHCAPEERP